MYLWDLATYLVLRLAQLALYTFTEISSTQNVANRTCRFIPVEQSYVMHSEGYRGNVRPDGIEYIVMRLKKGLEAGACQQLFRILRPPLIPLIARRILVSNT